MKPMEPMKPMKLFLVVNFAGKIGEMASAVVSAKNTADARRYVKEKFRITGGPHDILVKKIGTFDGHGYEVITWHKD